MSYKIKKVKARQILDSRGVPTIEVVLETDSGIFTASVPSGTSKGKYEAVELRDKDGRGVSKAIENIGKVISPALRGKEVNKQEEIDKLMIELDGTENKSRLGANAILAVSIAVCRAGSAAENRPLWDYICSLSKKSSSLPSPFLLVVEGGLHSETKAKLNIQEFIITTKKPASGEKRISFRENFEKVKAVYDILGSILKKKYGKEGVITGYEGGFTPPIEKTKEVLDLILKAIKESGFEKDIKIALDVAASSFYSGKKYKFEGGELSSDDLLDFYFYLLEKYPIISIEDPFAETDREGWEKIKLKIKDSEFKPLIVGDDLTATNKKRAKEAAEKEWITGIIIKPNQVGTITETIDCVKEVQSETFGVFLKPPNKEKDSVAECKKVIEGLKTIVSHRSGDTLDDFIADLAVGIGADYIKAGGPYKKERAVKYRRLLEIEKELV